ncbi:MAG: PAS domain S-box protein [Methanomassiliicoccales archaeon]
MITVLYVDDEPSLLELAKEFLERDGDIRVVTSDSAMDALVKLEALEIDAIVCDYQMPLVDGINFLKTVRLQGRKLPFILFTGKGREDVVIEALNNGADFYLQKGGDPKAQFVELINMIKRSVEQREASESIEESEQIYEKLFKENIEGMLLIDPVTGVIIDANGAAVSLFGYSYESLVGMHISKLSPNIVDVENFRKWHDGIGKGVKVQGLALLANGETREVEIFSGMLKIKGRRLGYAMIHDVTELCRAHRREHRMSIIFKTMSFASLVILRAKSEIELLINICNGLVKEGEYCAAWIGDLDESSAPREIVRSESELISREGKTIFEKNILEKILRDVYRTSSRVLYILNNEEKSSKRISYSAYPIVIENKVKAVLIVAANRADMEKEEVLILEELAENISHAIKEISDRQRIIEEAEIKAAEERLWSTGNKLRAIIQTSPMAIVTLDPEGNVLTWNPAAEKIFGWDSEKCEIFKLPLKENIETKNVFHRMLRGENIYDFPFSFEGRTINICSAPILDQEGQVSSIIIVASDITERKAMEDRLLQLNDILRLVNRILRHDTLNELMVLSGSLEMYQRTKQERFLDTATKAVNRSVEMIRRMKELESLVVSGGSVKLYDLKQTAEKVLRGYMVDFNVEGEGMIYADDALPSAIDNIVRNAMIHGKADHIKVKIWNENGQVILRIADDGIGIPDSIKPRIFEEGFSYGGNAGTGLGLYLVSKAIERYRGNVRVEDNEPRGTAFVFTFPGAQ